MVSAATDNPEVIIIGAGGAGLMCAISAGYRGRRVLLLDQAKRPGKKVLMAGGGRCNFTNLHVSPANFLSNNPHFCISALKRYHQQHFIDMVERHGIDYHEKAHGQLFCDHSSKDILNMLLTECEWAGVELRMRTQIEGIKQHADGDFHVRTDQGDFRCQSLVIATGGLSIPNSGATGFGLEVAHQFGLKIIPTHAALVPFTLQPKELELFKPLAGVSVPASIACNGMRFRENLLFTHRGLSGPAVLQISNYWQPGDRISINLFPDLDLHAWLQNQRQQRPKAELRTLLGEHLSKRLAALLCELWHCDKPINQFHENELQAVAEKFSSWQVKPSGTEGYRTAEVMQGGVDTDELSSKTFEARKVPGLYFIGEVVDVTGWLGGYNLQWAWASGHCAGQFV